jgi:hypothetical protein
MRSLIGFCLLLSASLASGQIGTCPPAQSQRLATWLASPPNRVAPEKQKPVATRAQLQQVCVPGGQKAYLVSRGVLPPKFEQSGPATASESVMVATGGGQKWVMMRVSEQGRITAAYIITEQNNLAQEVTPAFKDWKLAPATFRGTPVPIVLKLKMDFNEVR